MVRNCPKTTTMKMFLECQLQHLENRLCLSLIYEGLDKHSRGIQSPKDHGVDRKGFCKRMSTPPVQCLLHLKVRRPCLTVNQPR